MIFAGIDAGSRAIKVVLIDENLHILGMGLMDQGVRQAELAHRLLEQTAEGIGVKTKDVAFTLATGYGREALEFADTTVTEITCHARGVCSLIPVAKTVIDIGGQDSKLIRLDEKGRVRDFVMNDRCAAGTGRFLEVVARQLHLDIRELDEVAMKATVPSVINSMCVVFAETEIIGLLASGESPENILAGVQISIATRISSMAGRQIKDPIVFTGGVAMLPGMVRILGNMLGHPITMPENPQMTGALGAAILASKKGDIFPV